MWIHSYSCKFGVLVLCCRFGIVLPSCPSFARWPLLNQSELSFKARPLRALITSTSSYAHAHQHQPLECLSLETSLLRIFRHFVRVHETQSWPSLKVHIWLCTMEHVFDLNRCSVNQMDLRLEALEQECPWVDLNQMSDFVLTLLCNYVSPTFLVRNRNFSWGVPGSTPINPISTIPWFSSQGLVAPDCASHSFPSTLLRRLPRLTLLDPLSSGSRLVYQQCSCFPC